MEIIECCFIYENEKETTVALVSERGIESEMSLKFNLSDSEEIARAAFPNAIMTH